MNVSSRVAVVVTLVAGPALTQTVWTVPLGAPLDTYIAQAAPGDILALSGDHPTFVLNKGLTILGRGTDPTTGSTISGFAPIWVAVPAGQRATLAAFRTAVFPATPATVNGIVVASGAVAIADVVANQAIRVDGEAILSRVEVTSGGLLLDGLCAATDCTLLGRDFAQVGTSVRPATPGILVGNAAATLLASRVVARGGLGGSASSPPVQQPGCPGLQVAAGRAWLTDSALQGGAGTAAVAGGVALAGNGNVAIARTALTDDVLAVGISSGYQIDAAQVGMHCPAPPQRGATLTVTATAGASSGLFGIVAGLERTVNVLPPIVQPLFGNPSQLIALVIALPAPGAAVPAALPVPSTAALFGVEVWLQAVQLAGAGIHASTVVGGAIR